MSCEGLMPELKTKPTTLSVTAFLKKVSPEQKRTDCLELARSMRRASGKSPKMWGTKIVGFGSYDYTYASGHSGTYFRVGFSPRASAIAVYFVQCLDQLKPELAKLGKFKRGGGCLYIRSLADVDVKVLEAMTRKAMNLKR
jgi:hypothetical protein